MLETGQLQKQIKGLDTGDETTRRDILQNLKQPKEEDWANVPADAFNSVLRALQKQILVETKKPFIRREVVAVLGNMGARAASTIPQLAELLQDGIPDGIRESAAQALGKMGKEAKAAVAGLVHLLETGKPALIVQAARALADIGCSDQRVKNALVHLWTNPVPSQNAQVQVAIALCRLRIDAPGLISLLTRTLVQNPEAALRKAAAEALGWCRKDDTDVVPALLYASLVDKNEDVMKMAKTGLTHQKLSNDQAVLICAKQLKESVYALDALRHSGAASVPALIEALKIKDPITREKAARTLATLGEAAAASAPGLKAILSDKHLEVRLAAAKALWNVSKNAELVVPVLIDLLEEKSTPAFSDGDARRMFLQTTIEALWRIGPPATAAVPALKSKAKDKNRLISESALSALKTIAPNVTIAAGAR